MPENDTEWVQIRLQYSTSGEPVWEAGSPLYGQFARRWLAHYIKVHSAPEPDPTAPPEPTETVERPS